MTKRSVYIIPILLFILFALSCRNSGKKEQESIEDKKAKELFEGIWINEEEESIMFRVKGDTLYYPDSTSRPVAFRISLDTFIISGNNETKYKIVKQTPNIFEFKSPNGDIIKLIKSDHPNDSLLFKNSTPSVLNQQKTIKRDTVITYGDKRYHCYIQINPTRYKIYRTFTNSEGLSVENIYYDNIIHISIFNGSVKKFSKDFKKADFRTFVPSNIINQMILSDIELVSVNKNGFNYRTQLAIPDNPGSFIINFTISYDGRISMHVA